MIKYEGTTFNQYDDDASGNAASGATITVRLKSTGAKASLFSDDGVTATTNPITSGTDGSYEFYVTDDIYNIVINEGLATEKTLGGVQIFRGLEKQKSKEIYVTDFGAYSDPTGTVDQTAFFELAAQAANGEVPVFIPSGFYKLNSATTTSAIWVMSNGTEITGIGGIAPTGERDTSRLTGVTVKNNKETSWNTLRIGDPKYTVQKATNKSFSAEIEGHSNKAAGGLLGTTYASARATVDASRHAVCGVAVNDINDDTGVWAGYLEAYILDGTDGNSFCLESTTFNANSTVVVDDTPNQSLVGRQGLTYNLWLTTGGDSAFAQPMYDTTAAVGILGKGGIWGAKYKRGIVCKSDSLATDDFCAIPVNYKYTWWKDGGSGDIERASIRAEAPLTSGRLYFEILNGDGTTYSGYQMWSTDFRPASDNTKTLGTASNRWSEVYASNATINTSDERDKQQQRPLSEVEKTVALACKAAIKGFKWNDAVAEKGSGARWHFGVMAQDVKAIFEAEGLDPDEYGLFCYDYWGDDPTAGITSGNRYGIRYTELLMFIMGAI